MCAAIFDNMLKNYTKLCYINTVVPQDVYKRQVLIVTTKLADEKNELHNRNLHISGLLNDEKVDIGDIKVDIENEKVDKMCIRDRMKCVRCSENWE